MNDAAISGINESETMLALLGDETPAS